MPMDEKKLPQSFLDAFEVYFGESAKGQYYYGHSWHVETTDKLYRVCATKDIANDLAVQDVQESLIPDELLLMFTSEQLDNFVKVKPHEMHFIVSEMTWQEVGEMSDQDLITVAENSFSWGDHLVKKYEIYKKDLKNMQENLTHGSDFTEKSSYSILVSTRKAIKVILQKIREEVYATHYNEVWQKIEKHCVSYLIGKYPGVRDILTLFKQSFITFDEHGLAASVVNQEGAAKFLAPVDHKEHVIDGYFVYQEE